MIAPQYPAGPYEPEDGHSDRRREQLIAEIEAAPAILRSLITSLTDEQLDTRYRNWSIRQIVHHMADSHVNSYIRYKWALTEERPTIKAYDEGAVGGIGGFSDRRARRSSMPEHLSTLKPAKPSGCPLPSLTTRGTAATTRARSRGCETRTAGSKFILQWKGFQHER